ncbi:MAG: hypothetical protein R3300_09725 [Candidatus Promineifilaceae bacterium]|nr:hypothetical protein [Candidatus Promineifilaceae bacterium]
MLTERIIGAFTFRSGVYKEVEMDPSFTSTAWLLVIVVSFLGQLGSVAGTADGFIGWIIGSIVGTVFAVIGFAFGAFIINWIGRSVFQADVTFEELVRTLGLAYVWRVVGFLAIIGAVSGALSCLLAPIQLIAFVAYLVAWFVAAREALDLGWGETILTVILGWVVTLIISIIAGFILAAIGLTTGAAFGLFG